MFMQGSSDHLRLFKCALWIDVDVMQTLLKQCCTQKRSAAHALSWHTIAATLAKGKRRLLYHEWVPQVSQQSQPLCSIERFLDLRLFIVGLQY